MARLQARYGGGWQVWYVPRATGKPTVTWHARRKDDEQHVIHADSADELAWAIECEEG